MGQSSIWAYNIAENAAAAVFVVLLLLLLLLLLLSMLVLLLVLLVLLLLLPCHLPVPLNRTMTSPVILSSIP